MRNYNEIVKNRIDSLDKKGKRLFELCDSVKTGRYSMDLYEVKAFAKVYENNLINGCIDIFNYGFLKGQRAMKAELKRKGLKV